MSIIGEAFVRVRPDTTGFKQETESQVKSAVSGVAKIIAGAFAIKGTFDFGKEIVTHAADVQKQVEAIKAEFGDASEAVLEFGEHGAAALGVSAHLADTTAARFGIIGQNLGLTRDQTANLTIGFEQLAGSISQIRNVDPERVFATLPLAIQGNLRSLKQLGIATDQTQLKIAAFKLGLTDTVSQALTPGERALAIYAIATAHLGEFQAQATSHAGDLANVQRRLSAEWDNSKDTLGRGLLPAMEKVFGFLANQLPDAVAKLTTSLRTLRDDINGVAGPIGGLKGAVEALIAAFAVGKIVAFAGAIRTDLIANGFAQLQVATKAEQAAYLEAFGAMEVATLGLAATIRSALISTGIGALAVAAGIAVELIINHWSRVKAFLGDVASYIRRAFDVTWTAVKEGGKAAAYALVEPYAYAVEKILQIASHLPGVSKYAQQALAEVKAEVARFRPDFGAVTAAWANAGARAGSAFSASALAAIQAALAANDDGNTTQALAGLAKQGFTTDLLTGSDISTSGAVTAPGAKAAAKALADLNDSLRTQVKANVDGIASARAALGSASQSLADAIRQQGEDVRQAVQQAKDNLTQLGSGLASTISTFIDEGPLGKQIQRLQDALTGRQQRDQRKQLVEAVKTAQKTLRDARAAVDTGGPVTADIQRGISEYLAPSQQGLTQARGALRDFDAQAHISSLQSMQQKLKAAIAQGFADLTDEFNRHRINIAQFNAGVANLLARGGITYRKAGATLGVAFGDGFRDQVTTILQQAFAINSGPQLAGISGAVVRPLEVLRTDQNKVAEAQHQVALKQTALQSRTATAAEKTAALLDKIASVQLGPTARTIPTAPRTTKPRNARGGNQ